jgi:hypothetical protein
MSYIIFLENKLTIYLKSISFYEFYVFEPLQEHITLITMVCQHYCEKGVSENELFIVTKNVIRT